MTREELENTFAQEGKTCEGNTIASVGTPFQLGLDVRLEMEGMSTYVYTIDLDNILKKSDLGIQELKQMVYDGWSLSDDKQTIKLRINNEI